MISHIANAFFLRILNIEPGHIFYIACMHICA
jgi:hypothetical protein